MIAFTYLGYRNSKVCPSVVCSLVLISVYASILIRKMRFRFDSKHYLLHNSYISSEIHIVLVFDPDWVSS